MEINNTGIILTGAASGIGSAILNELLKFDCKIIAADRNADWEVPGYTVYGATKAAIHRFAEGYRFDDPNEHLMVTYPIATRTRFFEIAGNRIPVAFPVQSPDSMARKIIRGIRKDRRKVYPSVLFRSILVINQILPFIKPVYQAIELRKMKMWLKNKM